MLLAVLAIGGRAWAGGKPPIAILGLEVYDNGGGIDPETTRAAKELTAALRDRAKAGTGPYAPVQGGEKELIDEKLLNNCDSEAPTCMAAIGTELGAEVLMYGRIEKANQNGQGIYRVSIKLLNVNRKQLASSTVETLPVTESNGVRASTHAKAWYSKLAGVVTGGSLAIRANIDRGTVMIDDEAKGNLSSGTLTLTGIAEGRHTLAVEAKDYQRYEAAITVRTGETTPQSVTMVELSRKSAAKEPKGPPISREGTVSGKQSSGGSNIWKPVFYGTAALTAAGTAFSVYELLKGQSNGRISPMGMFVTTVGPTDDKGAHSISSDQCDTQAVKDYAALNPSDPDLKSFNDACSNFKYQKIGWVVTGVVGVAAIGSFIMAYVRDSGSEADARSSLRGHRKRREFAVTPIMMPNGGGATLQFDW
ncbi:MAG TPA: PEGA domain-containing protein [Kofleriaceae bacterium]|nr:PEGA domain-containing protein [Kofleriaceae bacterium]